jgi:hypothetical protein
MTLKFGLLPKPEDSRDLLLKDYLNTAAFPPLPAQFGHENQVTTWQMLLNDQLGDCGPVAAIHHEMVVTAEGAGAPATFTDANVLKVYEDVGGYNPNDPSTDQGIVLRDLLKYWLNIGIPDSSGKLHRVAAFLSLDLSTPDEILYALYLFGGVMLGIQVPQSAMNQFDQGQPWSVVDANSPILGGHAIVLVAKREDLEIVTWGQLQKMMEDFLRKYGDEAWAVLSQEILNGQGVSPEGFNWQQLQDDLKNIKNVPPEPAPTPTPPTPPEPPTPTPPVPPAQQNCLVTRKVACIHDGPCVLKRVLCRVTKGTVLPVYDKSGLWYQVSCGNVKGWISKLCVKLV